MGRIRTIKPEAFTDSRLNALSPLHRWLFVGLWTEADREGRLDDDPATLKVRLLPYDACNVDALLADLCSAGLITRYVADNKRCICVVALKEHQHFNLREPVSKLPPPPDIMHVPAHVHVPVTALGREPYAGREGKGREGKGTEPGPEPSKDFFFWAQLERETAHGFIAEDILDPGGLRGWYAAALGAITLERLRDTYAAFLRDDFYRDKQRSKWKSFQTHWREFVPAERKPLPPLLTMDSDPYGENVQ